MSDEIHWEDPPSETRSGSTNMRAFIDALAAHPGKWAKLMRADGTDTFANSAANYMQNRYGAETRTRRAPDGRYWVWARMPEIEP